MSGAMTKREAAVKVVEEAQTIRQCYEQPTRGPMGYDQFRDLFKALAAYDSAPDEEGAGSGESERKAPIPTADLVSMSMHGHLGAGLAAIALELSNVAASVKERK